MSAMPEKKLRLHGRYDHGRIILDKPPALPEGARLNVQIEMEEVDENGWPIGFFERTAGSIPDLERPPQGTYEAREWPE